MYQKSLTVALLTVISATAFFLGLHAQDTDAAKEISKILELQAAAWNQGDLDRFMIAYWNDDRLTFSSGGQTQRGWQATRDRYAKRYPDQKTMGKLVFTELETQVLAVDVALTLGRWRLERDKPVSGNFSLVWKKSKEGWVIIHDHSSSDAS